MVSYSDLCLLNYCIEDNIDKLISYGADNIEIMMDGKYWCDTKTTIKNLSKKLTNYKVGFSVHPPAWDTNLTSENKFISEAALEEHKKAIVFANEINAKYVVIHPGFYYSPAFDIEDAKKRAYDIVSELNEEAKQLGTRLAVENVGYNGTSLFTEEEYISFVKFMDNNVGYLIDTGHANVNGWNIPKVIEETKDRLLAIHLHDNFGRIDEHNPIGEGNIAWDNVFKALKNTALDFNLVFEYKPGTKLSVLREHKEKLLTF